MKKEDFIKRTIKAFKAVPKYANSKRLETMAEIAWEDYKKSKPKPVKKKIEDDYVTSD